MCECGCGSFTPNYRFHGPGNTTYTLSIRPPCAECETPIGVLIQHITSAAAAESIGSKHAKPLPFIAVGKPVDGGWVECAIPLVSPVNMLVGIEQHLESDLGLDTSADVARALDTAMSVTLAAWEKSVAASAAPKRKRKRARKAE